MNDIQVGRFSQLLHKLLEIGEGSPAPTLAPELFAMLGLEVDRPEWEFLKGTKLCMGYHNIGSSTQKAMIGLRNPTQSGILVEIKQIDSFIPTGDYIVLTQSLGNATAYSGFSTGGSKWCVDFRWGVNELGYIGRPGCEIIYADLVIKGQAFYRSYPTALIQTSRVYAIRHPIILPANSAVVVVPAVDGVANYTSFAWTERGSEPMELQGVNPRLR